MNIPSDTPQNKSEKKVKKHVDTFRGARYATPMTVRTESNKAEAETMTTYTLKDRAGSGRESGRTILAAARRLYGRRAVWTCGDGEHTDGGTVTVATASGAVLGECVVYRA